MEVENNIEQQQDNFNEEIINCLQTYYSEIQKKQEFKEKELWNDINKETRNQEEEIKKIISLLNTEKLLSYFQLMLQSAEDILETLNQNNKQVKDQVEEDFVYGGLILEEMLERKSAFKNILLKYNISTDIDPKIRTEIKNKFDADQKVQEKDIEDFLKRYYNKFNIKNNEDDRESNWDNASSVAEDDVVYLDDELVNEMDKSFDEDGNQINEEDEEDEDDKKESTEISSDQSKEKTPDMSIKTFLKHTNFVSNISLNPANPNIFISGGGDDVARIWDINNNDKPLLEIPKQNETVDFAKFNFNGTLFATGALDGSVKIWDSQTGELKKQLEGPTDEIRFLNWHPKGNVLLAGSADNSVWMWNAISGQYMSTFTGHQQPLTCGQFTPDGNLIITASEDATIRVWKPKTGELIKKIQGYGFHQEQIVCFDVHPTQQVVVSGSVDKIACVSNYSTGKVLGKTIEHDDGVESVLFDHKLDVFYTGSLDGHARVFDLNKMTLKDKVSVEHSVTKMILLHEFNLLVVGNCNGDIHYFDHRKKNSVAKLSSGSICMLHDLIQYQQNKILASFDDGAIKLFEL